MKVLPQRMYTIVMRHLSGIQKGIQAGHAISNAFELKYGDTPEYKRWASKDMTLIVLETHTTDSLESAVKKLQKNKIPVAAFREPDLGNVVTAIAFLADERAYRLDKYPDTPDDLKQAFLRDFTKKFALASN